MCTDKPQHVLAVVLLATGIALAMPVAAARAKVYHARDEALALAFPDAERVEARDVVLSQEQHDRIEKLARAPLDTSLITIYVGWKGSAPAAYAIFDTHTVRTFPETFLVVISPDGKVKATQVLAFHEPEEYLPTRRWLDTFQGAALDDDLQVGRHVAGISGSTLSTRAVTSGIRRALAIWNVVIGGK
ncbi:MAG TPA: FMN-binding protein [Candidatus Limnocylindrales bacterium]|nr:FMN-binding protein [Candidatus Limnocylindrales bacterium]